MSAVAIDLTAIEARASAASEDLVCCGHECKTAENVEPAIEKDIPALVAEVKRLRNEVDALRTYGNKDCTSMADEALARGWPPA